MLEKLRKTLSKEFTRVYEKMESNYLGLENRIYSTIETRISTLEAKFEELSELIKEEMRQRIERNEDKIDENDIHDDDVLFSESVEEVKEALEADINDVKENVTEQVDKLSKKAKKKAKNLVSTVTNKAKSVVEDAKKMVNQKGEEAKQVVEDTEDYIEKQSKKAKKKIKEAVEVLEEKVKEQTAASVDDLTELKGLGEKISARLKEEGITSFKQLAELSSQELEEIDQKIRSFGARYQRYNWKEQAKNCMVK